jgi:hypothetical protein
MKKDIHIQKLKTVIFKFETHMKVNLMQNQETINRVGSLTLEELSFLEEQVRQFGENLDPFALSD